VSGEVDEMARVLSKHHHLGLVVTPEGWGWRCECGALLPVNAPVGMAESPPAKAVAAHVEHQAATLADLLAATRAEAWDEGYDAGHEDARAVQPTYPEPTRNPYHNPAASPTRGNGGDQ
jgi:hypothetical protein